MSPLQIWNYLGLGRIGKSEFYRLGGLKIILHLLCFISNAVKNQPVDQFQNFEGVA